MKTQICEEDFKCKYEVEYIEAHYKVPIYTYSANQVVKTSDLALLCPNCHKAVHIYMKRKELGYEEIKKSLRVKVRSQFGDKARKH